MYLMSNDFDVTGCFTDDCEIIVCEALAKHLSWIDTFPIASTLDDLFSSHTIKKWIYSPLLLFKLLILQDFKKKLTPAGSFQPWLLMSA